MKAIHRDVERTYQPWREALQQPTEPKPLQQRANVIRSRLLSSGARNAKGLEITHQMLGSRSKYSSSSFLPPSPLPSSFSDWMNSMRSIHLTIL